MSKWIEVVELKDIQPDTLYFIGKRLKGLSEGKPSMFWSRGLNGKQLWSVKPGIAMKFKGSDLPEILAKHDFTVAVKVPADADKRWKARGRHFY